MADDTGDDGGELIPWDVTPALKTPKKTGQGFQWQLGFVDCNQQMIRSITGRHMRGQQPKWSSKAEFFLKGGLRTVVETDSGELSYKQLSSHALVRYAVQGPVHV